MSRPPTPHSASSSSQLHFNFPPSTTVPAPFTLRDSVCERPPPHADNAADAPDFGLFRAGKKLCVRHEKMADEGINAQLQNSLDVLPLADRQAINAVWSTFSGSSHPRREIILKGLLTMCCFSQLSLLSTQVHNLIRLDPFALFPREVSLKVLSYLDAFSLGMAVQVSKDWKTLADDDLLWRGMCVQHIERKCTKCGWGLPLLERRRLRLEIDGQTDSAPTSGPSSPALDPSSPYFHSHADPHSHHHNHDSFPHIPASADYPTYHPTPLQNEASTSSLPQIGPLQITGSASVSHASSSTPYNAVASSSRGRSRTKRSSPPSDDEDESDIPSGSSNFLLPPNPYSTSQPNKRRQPHSGSGSGTPTGRYSASPSVSPPPPSSSLYPLLNPTPRPSAPRRTLTRPWKEVYTERLTIERNWRKGRYTARVFKGHTDGVMCLQVMEGETARAEAGPSCGKSAGKGEGEGVLITGSYDRTARVWDLETGEEVMVLRGHARGIRALQFDSAILITGSMDHTMKIWNWRTGVCIRTLAGHTDGIVCLNYDKNVLASGSADSTIKIWNFRNGDCFTLRGHRDWVNSVVLWDGTTTAHEPEWSSTSSLLSSSSNHNSSSTSPPHPSSASCSAPAVDPGKMLFSGSDDGTIRLWDLSTRECVKVMEGHVGQVQSMRLVIVDREKEDDDSEEEGLGIMRGPAVQEEEEDAEMGTGYEPNPLGVSGPFSHPLPIVPGHVGRHHHHHGAQEPAMVASTSTTSSARNETAGGGGGGGNASREGGKQAILVSASLDNTVKVWDVETGKSKKTLFGHIEGVWGVDVDPLRVVSSSHDRTIKVWSRDDGKCTQTLVGHRGAVTCLQLTDTQILSGSDDGEVRVWNFGASSSAAAK